MLQKNEKACSEDKTQGVEDLPFDKEIHVGVN